MERMKDTDEVSDAELVKQAAAGDEGAFALLYQRYRLPLYGFLNRKLYRQQALTDDLFQQTWIKVSNNLKGYEERQKFSSWLFRIAQNLVIDHFRQAASRQTDEIEERHAQTEATGWDDLDDAERFAKLWAAVETLPPEQREVVLLRQREVPFKEIAVIQKASINTVLGRMHYAVKALRKQLGEWKP